jgi:hypothetical protein
MLDGPPGQPPNPQWDGGYTVKAVWQPGDPPAGLGPVAPQQQAHGFATSQGPPGESRPQGFNLVPPQMTKMPLSMLDHQRTDSHSDTASISTIDVSEAQAQPVMKPQLVNVQKGAAQQPPPGFQQWGDRTPNAVGVRFPPGQNPGPQVHMQQMPNASQIGQPNMKTQGPAGNGFAAMPQPGLHMPMVPGGIRTAIHGAPVPPSGVYGQTASPIAQRAMYNQTQVVSGQSAPQGANPPIPEQSPLGATGQSNGPKPGMHYSPVGSNPYSPGQDSSPSNYGGSPMNTQYAPAPLFSGAAQTQPVQRNVSATRRPPMKSQVSDLGFSTDDDDRDGAATVVSADDVSVDEMPPSVTTPEKAWTAQDYSGGDWGDDDDFS